MISKTKRLISAVMAAAVLSTGAQAAFTDVSGGPLADAAEVLGVAGILDGYGDGTYRPDDYVTREQFAKIAVCILGRQENAAAGLAATAFTDVAPDSWARGYIAYVAESGIIAGFPDGSFGGSKVITYAQAAAVLMRCLGYTDEDIGFHWPSDYVNKAAALGIGEGLALSADDPVTRGNLAIMVNNALFVKLKDSDDYLISLTGLKVHDDALLYGLNRSDPTLAETSAGSVKITSATIGALGNYGKTGRLFVNKDNELVLFKSDGGDGREIIVASSLNNTEHKTVDISYDGGTVSLPYSGTVFSDGEKTTAESAAGEFTTGSRLRLFYDDDGAFISAVLDAYTMAGPVTAPSDTSRLYDTFGITSAPTVIRGGVRASFDEIALYDVVYYDENTNTLYAYNDKVSGIYEKAAPLKSAVTEVTVSGKTYKLASTEAVGKLNESANAFAIGDFVTLLLDRNGAVADVVDTSASVGRRLGVLLSSFSRIDDNGNQNYAVKLLMTDGSTMEYTADREYKNSNGNLYSVNFKDGVVSLSSVRYNSKSGKINKELMSFDGSWLASDCCIFELVSQPADGGEAVVRKIRFNDIEGTQLAKQQVIHVEYTGEMNDVALLYLRNVTKTDYEYGIVTKTDTETKTDGQGNIVYDSSGNPVRYSTGGYSVIVHGEKKTINADRRVFATAVIGISSVNDTTYVDAALMGTGRRLTAVSADRVKVGSDVYKAAENVDIYREVSYGDYVLISPEEAMKLEGQIEVYGDNTVERGGRVRVIIIR